MTDSHHCPNSAPVSEASREELRRRLRQKIKGKRSDAQHASRQLLDDPTAALLTMGIDDAAVLRMASKMLENPQQSLAKLNNLTCAAASKSKDEEEEEAPPPC